MVLAGRNCGLSGEFAVSYIRFDASEHPIVFLEMNGAVTEAQVLEYLEQMREVIERQHKFSVVVDLSAASIPSLKARGLLRDFANTYERESDEWTVSSSLIIHNPAIKMAVTAIYAVVRTQYPKRVFRNREDAVAWTKGELGKAGVL
jgi:hypothetical protein